MDLAKLRLPFPFEDIEWRIAQSGTGDNGPWAKILAYITARACQERLDDVFGPLGWKCEYLPQEFMIGEKRESAFICRLSVRDEKDEWIFKEDGAGLTDFEAFKGGLSGAFKRVCASGYGIGRYLYGLTEVWADCSATKQNGYEYAQTRDKKAFYWRTPANALPLWALPAGTKPQEPPKAAPAPQGATPEQRPTEENPFIGVVAEVNKRTWKNPKKNNEETPFYLVKMSNGEELITWEGETGLALTSAVGKMVSIHWDLDRKMKKRFVEFSFQR